MWDLSGHALLDFHLNGGTFNLGHRNPEVIAALVAALDEVDIGNHHFASPARARLGEELARLTPGDLAYSVFTQRRQRGDRRRDQERPPRDRPPAAGGARRRLPRAHRPSAAAGDERARAASCPTSRTTSRRCRSATWARSSRPWRAATSRRSAGDGAGDVRLPRAAGRLPARRQGGGRGGRRALVADEVQAGLGRTGRSGASSTSGGARPAGRRQGPLRRHLPAAASSSRSAPPAGCTSSAGATCRRSAARSSAAAWR